MGKSKICPPSVIKCVAFNLNSGSGVFVQTDMYLTKTKNTVTLSFCDWGGMAASNQKSTTAQNYKIPKYYRPICNQTFVISGKDSSTDESRPMKLVITNEGEITFLFSLDGNKSAEFPVFEGSSITWLIFAC